MKLSVCWVITAGPKSLIVKRSLITMLIVASAGVAAAQRLQPDPFTSDDTVARLSWLDHADVKADFHRVVEEQHDFRFLVVGTIGSYIPSGQYDPTALVAEYGSRNFATGCIIPNGEALRLRKKADAYADEYNQLLVRYLRSRKKT